MLVDVLRKGPHEVVVGSTPGWRDPSTTIGATGGQIDRHGSADAPLVVAAERPEGLCLSCTRRGCPSRRAPLQKCQDSTRRDARGSLPDESIVSDFS
jgi:hypothetical protein